MSIRRINESFSKLYSNKNLTESVDYESLEYKLNKTVDDLMNDGVVNIKVYEDRLQKVLEDEYPDKSWWDVTDCNIFWDLFENRDPYHTVKEILDNMKDGYVQTEATEEELTEDTIKTKSGKWVNKGDTGETHGEFKTKKEADAQRKAIFASGWKK